ncbi:nitrile hydratase accessory protein [Piscinibacter sp.]|uniref:nitrile hydratase accessory protein n=1 Tax=Piscinibacter sp. TaxID=1903157 RepID=UPI002B9E4D5A|nr:nitrile hydratase accessory protein [Albitalea sp.]HUG25808.1 nitrile hydratase accessory protein [Albitalea sp.]
MNAALQAFPATFPTPWAARAFALVNAVAEAGLFDLRDFQQALIESIRARESTGGCIGDEAAYYDCWIESLTTLLGKKGVAPSKLERVETAIRERLASPAHTHGDGHDGHDDDHDHREDGSPQPVFVEAAR